MCYGFITCCSFGAQGGACLFESDFKLLLCISLRNACLGGAVLGPWFRAILVVALLWTLCGYKEGGGGRFTLLPERVFFQFTESPGEGKQIMERGDVVGWLRARVEMPS